MVPERPNVNGDESSSRSQLSSPTPPPPRSKKSLHRRLRHHRTAARNPPVHRVGIPKRRSRSWSPPRSDAIVGETVVSDQELQQEVSSTTATTPKPREDLNTKDANSSAEPKKTGLTKRHAPTRLRHATTTNRTGLTTKSDHRRTTSKPRRIKKQRSRSWSPERKLRADEPSLTPYLSRRPKSDSTLKTPKTTNKQQRPGQVVTSKPSSSSSSSKSHRQHRHHRSHHHHHCKRHHRHNHSKHPRGDDSHHSRQHKSSSRDGHRIERRRRSQSLSLKRQARGKPLIAFEDASEDLMITRDDIAIRDSLRGDATKNGITAQEQEDLFQYYTKLEDEASALRNILQHNETGLPAGRHRLSQGTDFAVTTAPADDKPSEKKSERPFPLDSGWESSRSQQSAQRAWNQMKLIHELRRSISDPSSLRASTQLQSPSASGSTGRGQEGFTPSVRIDPENARKMGHRQGSVVHYGDSPQSMKIVKPQVDRKSIMVARRGRTKEKRGSVIAAIEFAAAELGETIGTAAVEPTRRAIDRTSVHVRKSRKSVKLVADKPERTSIFARATHRLSMFQPSHSDDEATLPPPRGEEHAEPAEPEMSIMDAIEQAARELGETIGPDSSIVSRRVF